MSGHRRTLLAPERLLAGRGHDQAVAARHAFILPALGYELYGKALLGRTDGDSVTPLV